jgi:hypothetical protein
MPEKFYIEQAEQIFPVERYNNLREFIETASPDVMRTAYFHVPTELFYEVENIRPYNQQQIADLAESIKAEGQLQAGIADLCTNDDGTFQLRIIAGKHRKKAIEKINFEKEPGEPVTFFEVRLFDKQLSAREIINIQMAENLQEKMTPAQDAVVIESMWQEYMVNKGFEKEVAKVKEFAAQISRSVDVVKDAIKYITEIDEKVQKLVDNKIIPYSMALLLCGISKEERGFGVSDQLRYAQTFFMKKFTVKQAREYLKNRKMKVDESKMELEQESAQLTFEENEDEAILKDHILSLHYASGMKVRENALWFVKAVRMIKLLNNEEIEAKFSAGIQKTMGNLGFSIIDFKKDLEPLISDEDYQFVFGENKGTVLDLEFKKE